MRPGAGSESDGNLHSDPDRLPYGIKEASTGRGVSVHFAPLQREDNNELTTGAWKNAVFSAVWSQLAGDDQTRKLICTDGLDRRIQGIVRYGVVLHPGGSLRKSLLETAPFNRYGASPQIYCGVGRVLVARLVVESILRGEQGRVAVRPRPGTEAFYLSLGFSGPPRYVLEVADAAALLESVLYTPQQEE